MVALKLNIAASALGKTPAGLGDLIFDRNTSTFDETSIRQIAASVDSMMTYRRTIDTASFAEAYQSKGGSPEGTPMGDLPRHRKFVPCSTPPRLGRAPALFITPLG